MEVVRGLADGLVEVGVIAEFHVRGAVLVCQFFAGGSPANSLKSYLENGLGESRGAPQGVGWLAELLGEGSLQGSDVWWLRSCHFAGSNAREVQGRCGFSVPSEAAVRSLCIRQTGAVGEL